MSAKGEGDVAEKALAELCQLYWHPLYAFLRRNGSSPSDAEDITQGFFEQILRRRSLDRVDPEKGKLRSFLLGGIKFYAKDEYRKAVREHRKDSKFVIPIDSDLAEHRYREIPDDHSSPEALFDRQWALTLLQSSVTELEIDYQTLGKSRLFELLSPFITMETDVSSYSKIAQQLEMAEGTVRVSAHRLRKDFRTKLRKIVSQTLADPGQAEEEIRHLMEILSQS